MLVGFVAFTLVPLVALFASAAYATVATSRLGDWRPALFIVLLVLMSVHQVNELRVFVETGAATASRGFGEYPETGVNLLSSLATVYILRFVRRERSVRSELAAKLDRERELRARNEKLQQFAELVSHDLRNPLQTAAMRVELAREGDDEHLAPVAAALDRMETIIEDALTLTRNDRTEADTERVQVGPVVRECWAVTGSDAATLELEESFTVEGDRDYLRHVFENLFRNSIEHGADEALAETDRGTVAGDGGGVTVRVGPLEDGVFYVEDDGPGIPEDTREDVFELGYTTAADGTGFGLTIVERLATAHGWEVRVTEGPDGGTRFEFVPADEGTERSGG